jgi:hypothetical protein
MAGFTGMNLTKISLWLAYWPGAEMAHTLEKLRRKKFNAVAS